MNFYINSSDEEASNHTCLKEETDADGFLANEFYVVANKVIQYTCHDDVDSIYNVNVSERITNKVNKSFMNLKLDLRAAELSIKENTGFYMVDNDDIQFVQVYDRENQGVKCSVTIKEDLSIKVYVHRKCLFTNHSALSTLPTVCDSVKKVVILLEGLSKLRVCVGNPDDRFSTFFVDKRECGLGAVNGDFQYSSTLRSAHCELLISGFRCQSCIRYPGTLRKKESDVRKNTSNPSPNKDLISNHKTHSTMSKEELCEKIDTLQKKRRSLNSQINTLQEIVQKHITEAEILTESENSDVNELVQECTPSVESEWPAESFQRLFWEEQLKYNKLKDPRGMRWHPMIIKWAIYIKSKGTKAYEAVTNAGFIKMPNIRTLYNYSHFTDSKCGINPQVLEQMIKEAKAKGLYDEPYKQYVGILQDEVRVKEDLVYDKHSGELVGFVDLDKTGNQLIDLENTLNDESRKLAKYVLLIMVRGACTDFRFPLASYATDGITSDLLYSVIWPAIEAVEVVADLKIIYITCDGASPNRRFFEIHGDNNGNSITYYTVNPFDPDRKIYFVSDPPHLVKTARNCFANSDSHRLTRKLWNNGKSISWMHIVDLYRDHCENIVFSKCPKLKRDHIDLTAFSTMKVNLAAQVFSSTVAHALEEMYGPHVQETVKLVKLMDKFFDCANCRSLNEGIYKRKDNLKPYRDVADPRLQWMENGFLQHFTDWRTSVEARPGVFTKGERNKMMLSHQTLKGLEITARSLVALVRFLLQQGAPFVLTAHFNQDPIEQEFGKARQSGGAWDHPTVYDLNFRITQLRVIGSQALAPVRGNTKRNQDQRTIDNTPLPRLKRRRHRSQ